MKNYYGVVRTNYFHVKDEEKFRALMAKVICDDGRLELWDDETDAAGDRLFGFGVYGSMWLFNLYSGSRRLNANLVWAYVELNPWLLKRAKKRGIPIVLDNPIKAYGTYTVDIKLYPEIAGKLNVLVSDEELAARKAVIPTFSAAEAGVSEVASFVECLGYTEPPKRQAGLKVQEKEAAETVAKAMEILIQDKVL